MAAKTTVHAMTAIVTSEKSILNKYLGSTLNKIDGLMQNATRAGVDLSDDVELVVKNVTTLIKKTIQGFQEAGTYAVTAVALIAQENARQVSSSLSQVMKFVQEFVFCTCLCEDILAKVSSEKEKWNMNLISCHWRQGKK